MKSLTFLVLLGIHSAAAVTHSLKYFYTSSSGVPNFPEYVSVGKVDDLQISYCDSITSRNVPKQDWMNKATDDDPQYWESQTQICVGNQPLFKSHIVTAKQRFNHTGGVHIFQFMYGCEWDDETQDTSGSFQYGYDGEDFISFDVDTLTWTASKQQAVITKQKWDKDNAKTAIFKEYLRQQCPDWAKKYVNYGRSSLLRTDLPSVSLLQKSPSSPVSCHATGFYPDRATMFWRKDGEELQEDVDHGEILTNHDGTFQMSMKLDVSSVKPEDWKKYDCVFQLSGVKDDITIKLDKSVIKTNAETSMGVIIAIIAGVILVVLIGLIGFIIYRKKNAKRPPSPVSSTDVMEQLNPTN